MNDADVRHEIIWHVVLCTHIYELTKGDRHIDEWRWCTTQGNMHTVLCIHIYIYIYIHIYIYIYMYGQKENDTLMNDTDVRHEIIWHFVLCTHIYEFAKEERQTDERHWCTTQGNMHTVLCIYIYICIYMGKRRTTHWWMTLMYAMK